ncbi:MAG: helix-turn-helix transcriptional regulator [Pseudomonadota bacterium]
MRTSEQMRVDSLVKELYRTELQLKDDLSFNWILEQIVEGFGCSSTGIISAGPTNQPACLTNHYAIDSKYVSHYNDYYNRLDPTFAVLACRSLKVIADHVTERNIPNGNNTWSEFASDFLRPQKHTYTAAINITSKLDGITRAWIWTRTNAQGAFKPDEINRLETIGFHMSEIYAQKELNKKGWLKNSVFPEDFVRRFNCTRRQAEIAHAACTSTLTLQQIAQKFHIDISSVKSHLTPIYQSAGLKRRGLTALMLGLPVDI